jgi:hypothetical protein
VLTLSFFQDLLPIVYQILKHHCGLIYTSRVKILDDREFTRAASSLTQTLKLVKFRVETLESVFLISLPMLSIKLTIVDQAPGSCLDWIVMRSFPVTLVDL